jgi:hypothetical protein
VTRPTTVDIDIRDAAPESRSLLIFVDPLTRRVFSQDAGAICLGSFPAHTVASTIESWLDDHEDRLVEVIDAPKHVVVAESVRSDLKAHITSTGAIYYDFGTVFSIDVEGYLDDSRTLDDMAREHVSHAMEELEMHLRESDVRGVLGRQLAEWLRTAGADDPRRGNVLRLLGAT